MRPNKKEPESALFWFQNLPIYTTWSEKRSPAWRPPTHREQGSLQQVGRMAASYKASEAKSARRDRSPRSSVMWPACSQLLKRSTAKVRPEVVSVR
jgi:hypothetical protein